MILVKLNTVAIKENLSKNFSKADDLTRYCEENIGVEASEFLKWENLDISDMPLCVFFEMYYKLNSFCENIFDLVSIVAGEFSYSAYKDGKSVSLDIPVPEKPIQKKILEKQIDKEELKEYIYSLFENNREIEVDKVDLMFIPFKVKNNKLEVDVGNVVQSKNTKILQDELANKFKIATISCNENSLQVEVNI